MRFVQCKVTGSSDALTKDINLARGTEQRFEMPGFLVRISGIESDKMRFLRIDLIVELFPSLIAASVLFGHTSIPEIIHIEANDPAPINIRLTSQSIEKS